MTHQNMMRIVACMWAIAIAAATLPLWWPVLALAAGPSIQEIHPMKEQDFWGWLLQLPETRDAQMCYALIFGCAVGMIGHCIRGIQSGEIAGNPLDYFIRQNPWRSVSTAIGVIMWSVGEVAAGIFVSDSGVFIGWGAVVLSGVKTGYAGDSLVNKGDRVVWSKEKRDAAATVSAVADAEDKKPTP